MSNLADLITKKRAQLLEQQAKEEKEKKDSELAPFITEQSYPLPEPLLFLAAWTPFLRSPFKHRTDVRREYIKWLLSPSLYVLNTFPRIESEDLNDLLKAFLSIHSISQPLHLHYLWILLSDISYQVPLSYKQEFLNIILGIEEEKIPS